MKKYSALFAMLLVFIVLLTCSAVSVQAFDLNDDTLTEILSQDTDYDGTKETALCKIKGNINADGEKIYHVPSGQFYKKTKIDISKGERWFCTEAQARDAGWRASMR